MTISFRHWRVKQNFIYEWCQKQLFRLIRCSADKQLILTHESWVLINHTIFNHIIWIKSCCFQRKYRSVPLTAMNLRNQPQHNLELIIDSWFRLIILIYSVNTRFCSFSYYSSNWNRLYQRGRKRDSTSRLILIHTKFLPCRERFSSFYDDFQLLTQRFWVLQISDINEGLKFSLMFYKLV